MNKKDFEIIAEVLRNGCLDDHSRHLAALDFSYTLLEVYPNFDRDKFMRACGYEETEINGVCYTKELQVV